MNLNFSCTRELSDLGHITELLNLRLFFFFGSGVAPCGTRDAPSLLLSGLFEEEKKSYNVETQCNLWR